MTPTEQWQQEMEVLAWNMRRLLEQKDKDAEAVAEEQRQRIAKTLRKITTHSEE